MESKDQKITREIVDFVSKNNLRLSHSISNLKESCLTFCDDINFTREINCAMTSLMAKLRKT